MLVALAPFVPLACGSFGSTEEPPEGDAGTTETGVPVRDDGGSADVVTIDDASLSTDARRPPDCPLSTCPDDVEGDDCTDDECDDPEDFSGSGAQVAGGRCMIAQGVGAYADDRPRTDTPSRFVELSFELVAAGSALDTAIAELRMDDPSSPRVTLRLDAGKLRLCSVTSAGTLCSQSINVPTAKRVHLYGLMNHSLATPQVFGVSVDCQEVLRVDVDEAFGAGQLVLAKLGCLDQPCSLTFDNVVLLTRP